MVGAAIVLRLLWLAGVCVLVYRSARWATRLRQARRDAAVMRRFLRTPEAIRFQQEMERLQVTMGTALVDGPCQQMADALHGVALLTDLLADRLSDALAVDLMGVAGMPPSGTIQNPTDPSPQPRRRYHGIDTRGDTSV